jgi:hypothetical protein
MSTGNTSTNVTADLTPIIIRQWTSVEHRFDEQYKTSFEKGKGLEYISKLRSSVVGDSKKTTLELTWIHIPDNDVVLCEVRIWLSVTDIDPFFRR